MSPGRCEGLRFVEGRGRAFLERGFVVGKIWVQGGNLANANLLKRECGEPLGSAIVLKAQNEGGPALPCPPPGSYRCSAHQVSARQPAAPDPRHCSLYPPDQP